MNLTDKHILITGASSGLGLSIAKQLLEKKALVTILSRNLPKLEQLKSQLNSQNLSTYGCDITDPTQVNEMASKLTDLDILINCAGIWLEGRLETYSSEQIQQTLNINLLGTILVTKSLLPILLKKDQSIIVNTSSTSGLIPKPEQSVYCASKFGIQGFTEALKQENWDKSIHIIGFYPGGMDTGFHQKTCIGKDTSCYMNSDQVAEVLVYTLERDPSMLINPLVVNRRQ